MRRSIALFVSLAATLGWGQRHKANIDPESKEGYVLQVIQQERNPAQKVKLLNEFVVEFPKSASLSWAYDQLQPVYLESKDYEKVLILGSKMLELDADDLDAAHSMLLAAEALKDPEKIAQNAAACWKIATRLTKVQNYAKPDYAKQVIAYSEYSLGNAASLEPDKGKRQAFLKTLEELNPKSSYLKASKVEVAAIDPNAGKAKQVEAAEQSLATDPNNEDLLMLVADYYMQLGKSLEKVHDYSQRTIDILRTKAAPSGTDANEWNAKKERYIGLANYMVGIIASIRGSYQVADRSLRAALPTVRGSNEQMLGATLYHLGYANYQLAERGERQRVFDAIKFNEACSGVRSTYREQAQKNVESIRAEYNLRP